MKPYIYELWEMYIQQCVLFCQDQAGLDGHSSNHLGCQGNNLFVVPFGVCRVMDRKTAPLFPISLRLCTICVLLTRERKKTDYFVLEN